MLSGEHSAYMGKEDSAFMHYVSAHHEQSLL